MLLAPRTPSPPPQVNTSPDWVTNAEIFAQASIWCGWDLWTEKVWNGNFGTIGILFGEDKNSKNYEINKQEAQNHLPSEALPTIDTGPNSRESDLKSLRPTLIW